MNSAELNGIFTALDVLLPNLVESIFCGYIDVDGVDYCPFDLRAGMAMYDGAGVIVIGGGGCVAGWWWCWFGVYEVKCDDCGDSCDGGGDILVGHD